ncbi:MAG: hypothetical protein LBH93_08695 [Chitinispirillales bacterium]|jgi:hypothetical protein|nr:hypothetical protein [Chitinispirillales bacterium]
MKSRVKLRKYPSYKAGLLLALLFVISWVMIDGMRKSGLPSGLASLLHSDFENFKNLEQFDSAKSLEVQKAIAGLRVYAEGDPESSPVAKRESMELIDNGMLWMVSAWDINTPSGERHTMTHVMYGYVRPYSYSPDNRSYYCEVRIIRQIFANGLDTCYGASQVDEIWQIGIGEGGGANNVSGINNNSGVDGAGNNAVLTVNRREYRPYVGDIKKFFPGNAAILSAIDKITLGACPASATLPWFSKKTLARSMDAVPFFARAGAIESLIRSYYKPIVLDELARRYDPRAVPDAMDIRMTVSPEGAVTGFKLRRSKIQTKRFDDLAALDMKSWLFPAVADSDEGQTIEVMVRVK